MKNAMRAQIAFLVLLSLSSHAGSRVGGGTLSNEAEGYTFSLPGLFSGNWDQVNESWIRLRGPKTLSHLRVKNNVIEVLSLRLRYDEAVLKKNRSDFVAYFKKRGFSEVSTGNPCMAMLKLVKASGVFVVGAWGGGRGVIITGPNTQAVSTGIDSILPTMELLPGACVWK